MKHLESKSLLCPHCGLERLKIFPVAGSELICVWVTGLRKYRCVGCGHCFRAKDRRMHKREAPEHWDVIRFDLDM
jgi:rubredoxin